MEAKHKKCHVSSRLRRVGGLEAREGDIAPESMKILLFKVTLSQQFFPKFFWLGFLQNICNCNDFVRHLILLYFLSGLLLNEGETPTFCLWWIVRVCFVPHKYVLNFNNCYCLWKGKWTLFKLSLNELNLGTY